MIISIDSARIAAGYDPTYQQLGSEFELRPIKIINKKGIQITNTNSYSHLYKNGKQISDAIFRVGGMGGKFKDGYCELITYEYTKSPKNDNELFTSGDFCLINGNGNIAYTFKSFSNHYHLGGKFVSENNFIIDIETKDKILPHPSNLINGHTHLIIEHSYSWKMKEIPIGIYQLNKFTGELIKIDEV